MNPINLNTVLFGQVTLEQLPIVWLERITEYLPMVEFNRTSKTIYHITNPIRWKSYSVEKIQEKFKQWVENKNSEVYETEVFKYFTNVFEISAKGLLNLPDKKRQSLPTALEIVGVNTVDILNQIQQVYTSEFLHKYVKAIECHFDMVALGTFQQKIEVFKSICIKFNVKQIVASEKAKKVVLQLTEFGVEPTPLSSTDIEEVLSSFSNLKIV